MLRAKPIRATIEALFRKSQNQCSFPGCTALLVEGDDLFVGQVAHIKAASIGGPRYDEIQTDDQRRAQNNLMLVCYPHHRRIDRFPERYTTNDLFQMKLRHENLATSEFFAPSPVVSMLIDRMSAYWSRLDYISEKRRKRLEVAVSFDSGIEPEMVGETVVGLIADLRAQIPILIDMDKVGDGIIGISNNLQQLEIKSRQLDLLQLYSILILGEGSSELPHIIKERKGRLRKLIEREVSVD